MAVSLSNRKILAMCFQVTFLSTVSLKSFRFWNRLSYFKLFNGQEIRTIVSIRPVRCSHNQGLGVQENLGIRIENNKIWDMMCNFLTAKDAHNVWRNLLRFRNPKQRWIMFLNESPRWTTNWLFVNRFFLSKSVSWKGNIVLPSHFFY